LCADAAWLDELAVGATLAQPKIQNIGVLALGDENVRRLDVAVDNTLEMRGVYARSAGCGGLQCTERAMK
jgi:hypothetical protein